MHLFVCWLRMASILPQHLQPMKTELFENAKYLILALVFCFSVDRQHKK